MTYFDFHVHLDHYPDAHKIAREYEYRKIYALFVTNLPELFEKQFHAFSNYKYVRIALGYHPDLTDVYPLNCELFDRLTNKTNYIGEVGIDITHNNTKNIDKQIENFKFVTQEKYNKNKIYSVHSKGAEDIVLEILVKNKVKHAVFHWYTGKISTLKKIVEQRYMFSINISMLKSKKGQNIIKSIPTDLLLYETDGPFTRFQGKVVKPSEIEEIYALFNREIKDFNDVVYKNFKRLLLSRELHSRI